MASTGTVSDFDRAGLYGLIVADDGQLLPLQSARDTTRAAKSLRDWNTRQIHPACIRADSSRREVRNRRVARWPVFKRKQLERIRAGYIRVPDWDRLAEVFESEDQSESGRGPLAGRSALHGAHLRTLKALFRHPTAHNLEWMDVIALFEKIGCGAPEGQREVHHRVGRRALPDPKGAHQGSHQFRRRRFATFPSASWLVT